MQVPRWYREADLRSKQRQEALQQEAVRNAPRFDIKDSPTGWALLPGYPYYQVVPSPEYPWDPAVVRAMVEVDPRVVPLWVIWAYKPPVDTPDQGVYVTGRHGIGLAIDNPKGEQHDFHCLMPTGPIHGLTFKRPTVVHKIYHVSHETEERIGGFVPWSWWMYYNLREEFVGDKPSTQTGREFTRAARESWEKKTEQRSKERSYIFGDVNKYVTRVLSGVSEVEMKQYLLRNSR